MLSDKCANIVSGNGLESDGIKPLADPILTYNHWNPHKQMHFLQA